MKSILKEAWYGFLVWLIPFVIAIGIWPLHESDIFLFKTIMIVVGVASAVPLLNRYFMHVTEKYFATGIRLGLVWFTVNIVLDLVVLVGMFKSPAGEWFTGVGLRYLSMPVMSTGLGWILQKKQHVG